MDYSGCPAYPEDGLSLSPALGMQADHTAHQLLYVVSQGLNSGPCAFAASAIPTEPHPRPSTVILLLVYSSSRPHAQLRSSSRSNHSHGIYVPVTIPGVLLFLI